MDDGSLLFASAAGAVLDDADEPFGSVEWAFFDDRKALGPCGGGRCWLTRLLGPVGGVAPNLGLLEDPG